MEGEVKIVKKTRWGRRFKDVNTAKSSDGQRGSYFIKYCLRSFPQIREVCGKRKVLVSSQRKSPPITLFCRPARSYPPTFQWCFSCCRDKGKVSFTPYNTVLSGTCDLSGPLALRGMRRAVSEGPSFPFGLCFCTQFHLIPTDPSVPL